MLTITRRLVACAAVLAMDLILSGINEAQSFQVHSAENGTSTRQGIPFPPSLLRSDQNCIFICCTFLGFNIHVRGSVEHEPRTLSQQNEVKIYKFPSHSQQLVLSRDFSCPAVRAKVAGKDCQASFLSSFFTHCNNRKCIKPCCWLHDVLTRKDWALKACEKRRRCKLNYFHIPRQQRALLRNVPRVCACPSQISIFAKNLFISHT